MYRRFSHRVHLPQLQQDDTSLFHFNIAVKELNSLSKVLVVDELIRRQTLARPAALSPADSSCGEFLHRTVPTGWVHLPQRQKDDTSLFLLHFTIAVKELDSLSKVLVFFV